jgi:hypothetical protein
MKFDMNITRPAPRPGVWKRNAAAPLTPTHFSQNRHAERKSASVSAQPSPAESGAPSKRANWKALLAHREKQDLAAEISRAFFRPQAPAAHHAALRVDAPAALFRAALLSLPRPSALPGTKGAPRCDRPIFSPGPLLIAVTGGHIAQTATGESESRPAAPSLAKAA